MAVIRQKTQVFNQPVGVVRASSGSEVGQTIAQVASRISDMAYREAAINAEDVGQKAAMAKSSTDIVTIDPETGMPAAYAAPRSYGRIATRSYQNMIDRRFEESVLQEMKIRGKEVAETSSSAAQYRDRMSSYVEEMYKNGVDDKGQLNAYGRFIQEAGTEYIASTYSTLRNKEVAAARAAVIRSNQLAGYLAMSEIEKLIQSGAPEDQINGRLAAEAARNLDLYNTGSIKFGTFRSNMEKLEGFTGLMANNNLAKFYGSLSPADRAAVNLAIQDPAKAGELGVRLNKPDLGAMITKARISTGVPTLLAGLKTMGESVDTIKESAADQFILENGYKINPNMSANDLKSLISGISDPDVRADVEADMTATFVMTQLDQAAGSAGVMDVISNELEKVTPNLAMIEASISGPRGAEVREMLRGMTYDQRKELSKELTDRRAALNRLESSGEKAQELQLRARMIDLEGSQDLLGDAAAIKQAIKDSGLPNVSALLEGWGEAVTRAARMQANDLEITSLDQLEAMLAAIKSADVEFTAKTPDEQKAFDILKQASEVGRTTIEGYLSSRVDGWDSAVKASIEDNFIQSARAGIEQGSITPADLEKYDETVLGGKVLNASSMLQEEAVIHAIQNNIVLPSMARAMSAALTSTNEDVALSALSLFERMSNLQGRTERGVSMRIDAMRGSLSESTYALYSAAMFLQRKELVEPLVAIRRLKDYEGNIDADLKARLGISESAPLSDVLKDQVMSRGYRNEILNTLRVMQANNYPVDKDSIDSIIAEYTKGMASDDAVIGPAIGDKTVYARQSYMTQDEIISNRNALADVIADDPNFKKLLVGGTLTDGAMEGFRRLFPDSPRMFQTFMAAIGDIKSAERLTDRDRVLRGLEAIGVDLKYRPVVSAFQSGLPVWEVGYTTQLGGFQEILVNGSPWTLSKQVSQSQTQDEALFQATNQLNVAVRSGASPKDTATAALRVFAFRDHIRTAEQVRQIPEFEKIQKALGDEWETIFTEFRKEYESLPE